MIMNINADGTFLACFFVKTLRQFVGYSLK